MTARRIVASVLCLAAPVLQQCQETPRPRTLQEAADLGDAHAQVVLGSNYLTGSEKPQDYAKAVKWFRPAAEQGYAPAQAALAWCYQNGRGVPEDQAEALRWYRLAALQGDPSAQAAVGAAYYHGQGMAKDRGEALYWYRRAAKQGNPHAQQWLGARYEEGQGLPKNYAEAAKWYRRAAEQGHTEAQAVLGRLYTRKPIRDQVQAHAWLNLAAAQDHPHAGRARDMLERDMTSNQIKRAQQLAAELHQRMAAAKTITADGQAPEYAPEEP